MGILFPFQKNIRQEATTSKTYPYAIGKVELKFTLDQDIDKYLIPFKKCLEAALKDVSDDIEKLQAERKAKTKK